MVNSISFKNALSDLDDKTKEGLQITTNQLKEYFENGNTRLKTAQTWRESTADKLGSLDTQSKDALNSAIDTYLRRGLNITLKDGKTCPAVEVINQAKSWKEALALVRQNSEMSKTLNICAALLSMHSFVAKGERLHYNDKLQQYAKQFCKDIEGVYLEQP